MNRKLTIKQKEFVKRYIDNRGNGTQAALGVYDTKRPEVAKVIASENLTKPNIKREIELSLERAGLTDESISEMLREATTAGIGKKATNSDSLRGLEMMFRLKGAFPPNRQQSEHFRVEYNETLKKMNIKELEEELKKKQKSLGNLLEDFS